MFDLHHSHGSKLITIIIGQSAAPEPKDSRPTSDGVMIMVLNWSLELGQCNMHHHTWTTCL